MFVHLLERRLSKMEAILRLEIENAAPGERTRYREDRAALESEIALLRTLARTIEDWWTERSRLAIERISKSQE